MARSPHNPPRPDPTRTSADIELELLVLRAQAGEREAWSALVRAVSPALSRHAARLTGDPEGARDVAQEAWLAITKGLRRLNDPARFAGGAHRIVANKSADWVSKRAADRKAIAPLAHEPKGPGGDEPGDRRERVELLRRAINGLPSEDRALLALAEREGLRTRHIAEALGLPTGTVKSRLHRLRAQLREAIERADESASTRVNERSAI